ncbi:hypothetical protein [Pseudoduganella namucuonensis]|uniref:Phosphate starvation-inducible protein PsiF n=1 Tax=Pseudoduganella namucuonensis TaxID=1035707 RepID=A0A1I7GR25_9BURK|nr:hypothetical protein [Pseudoduganella namucuonensis]SFU50801.1 hypothetical protein SAMN05216552_100437 [Pseudoduganella namucuonensis]
MKTFTVSAAAFYFFYVLNGMMAPGQATREQNACQDPVMAEASAKSGAAGACKRDTMMASRAIAAN